MFTVFEAGLDVLVFVIGSACTYCLHRYIIDKMDMMKRLRWEKKDDNAVSATYPDCNCQQHVWMFINVAKHHAAGQVVVCILFSMFSLE